MRIHATNGKEHPMLVGVALALLAGCTVGPDYVRPTALVPITFKELEDWKGAQHTSPDLMMKAPGPYRRF
jgi:hypothetical protein